MSQPALELELMANRDFSKPRRIPALIDQGNGEALDISQFVFDPMPRKWRIRHEVIAEFVSAHHGAQVSDAELPEASEAMLKELNFPIPATVSAQPEAEATDSDKSPVAVAEGEKGKRGRKSKHNWKGAAVGESFEIPSPAITLTYSMIGLNKFALSVVDGKFMIERIG